MSQTLLFSIGLCVFASTVYGALFYGYYVFNRFYAAEVASEALAFPGSVATAAAAAVLATEATATT